MAGSGDDALRSSREPQPPPRSRSIVVFVTASIVPAGVPLLCGRVRALLATGQIEGITCDVGAITRPDLAVVETLARLQLTAQRRGVSIRLCRVNVGLADLLAFVGLRDLARG